MLAARLLKYSPQLRLSWCSCFASLLCEAIRRSEAAFACRCRLSYCLYCILFDVFTLYSWQRIRLDLLRSFPNVSWFNSCGRIYHGCNSRSTDKTFQQELASLFRHLSVFMRNRDIKHYLNFMRFGVQMGGYFLD